MRRTTGSRLIATGLIASATAALWIVATGAPRTTECPLRGPFVKLGGGYYTGVVALPWWSSWNRPPLMDFTAFEAGRRLGPGLVVSVIPTGPRSRTVAFLPTTASDPERNRRSYTVTYQELPLPLPVAVALLIAVGTAGFALAGAAIERLLARLPWLARSVRAVLALVLTAVLVEGTFTLLLADRLAAEFSDVRGLYAQTLGADAPGTGPGGTALFQSHPYLNFALNPQAAYMGERQIAPRYLIRRKEPVRPRNDVAWRVLVLGGSTTFGEYTKREEDTWVYRLEQKLRRTGGPGVDVINGGVGGYNVIENLLHYLLLLDDLEPDVVLLYVGINDVHPRLVGTLARDYTNSRLAWRADPNALPTAHPTLRRFATYRYLLLHELERRRFASILEFVQQDNPPVSEYPAALARNGPDVFAHHAENLVRLIRAQGRDVVIVPQVFAVVTGRDRAFFPGVREHNAVLEAIARRHDVPYVAAVLPAFGRTDLIDNCHFNRRGHEKMAKLLFRVLERARRHQPPRAPSAPTTPRSSRAPHRPRQDVVDQRLVRDSPLRRIGLQAGQHVRIEAQRDRGTRRAPEGWSPDPPHAGELRGRQLGDVTEIDPTLPHIVSVPSGRRAVR